MSKVRSTNRSTDFTRSIEKLINKGIQAVSSNPTLTLRFQGDIWEKGKGLYLPISAKFYYNIKETI